MTVRIIHADCLDAMRDMPDASVDSIVTDPPYGLGFMGKHWDHGVPGVDFWKEMLRIIKPGGHLLAFSGSRTYHRMTCAIEDAGFEIRDQIMWLYGSGFPKSHNLSGEHKGWGTALKPAHEPICVARKSLIDTVAQNVQQHGTGALNIDGCRIASDDKPVPFGNPTQAEGWRLNQRETDWQPSDIGRWPANVIHDGSNEVVNEFPNTESGKPCGIKAGNNNNIFGQYAGGIPVTGFGDSGSAARFFYCAKASKLDRDDGLESFELKEAGIKNNSGRGFSKTDPMRKIMRANNHPTVKPTELMRYLCRLVTPPHGIVLDPFMGSGSTGKAAVIEGFNFIGIERESGYCEIARKRVHAGAPLFADVAA